MPCFARTDALTCGRKQKVPIKRRVYRCDSPPESLGITRRLECPAQNDCVIVRTVKGSKQRPKAASTIAGRSFRFTSVLVLSFVFSFVSSRCRAVFIAQVAHVLLEAIYPPLVSCMLHAVSSLHDHALIRLRHSGVLTQCIQLSHSRRGQSIERSCLTRKPTSRSRSKLSDRGRCTHWAR